MDTPVEVKRAALRDSWLLIVVVTEDGREETLYVQPQHRTPGDGILLPSEHPHPERRPSPAARRPTRVRLRERGE